jgi:hypothetical protein
MCSVCSSWVLLKPVVESFFFCLLWKELPENDLYVSFAVNYFFKKAQVPQSILHLQHTRHQLSLDGAGLCWLDVDPVNSCIDYFAYLCTPASETVLHQKRMPVCRLISPLMTDCSNKLQKWTLLAGLRGCRCLLLLFYRV